MTDTHDHEMDAQPIEQMPAAPEADQGTRDADAPTWSPATEGHMERPLTAVGPAVAAGAIGGPGAPMALPDLITADRVDVTQGGAQRIEGREVNVTQGGAQRIEGREVNVTQGGAAVIRGDQVRVDQGGAAVIIARRVDMRDGGAFLLVAKRVSGDVRVALDWRGLAAVFAGIVAVLVVRGRR